MSDKETTQAQAARRIAALLALAEDASKQGNEAARDTYLEKASALQLQYVIDNAMLKDASQRTSDAVITEDFCEESNTPLIKAKRQLINAVALHARGTAVLMGGWKTNGKGEQKWDRRAKVRVWAHESDMAFIRTLYTSLLLQMQTMMARDERAEELRAFRGSTAAAWRVSYAHGWVSRVGTRLREIRVRQEQASQTREPGTALVLRDRSLIVQQAQAAAVGRTRKTGYKLNDTNAAGKAAGYVAGGHADLGQSKVNTGARGQLGS